MSTQKIVQINGDGIGQEVVPVAVELLISLCPEIQPIREQAGWNTFCQGGQSVPDKTLHAIREVDSAIFGAVSSPSEKVDGYQSAILKIRQSLGLNANIRPIDSRFGSRSESDFRFVIVRENSEGLYARIESGDDQRAVAEKVVTRDASLEIGMMAARVAEQYDLQKITIVHKANILPGTDGLFLRYVQEGIQQVDPDGLLNVDQLLVDTAALKIVEDPERFGVVVTTNLYGDILSDVAAYWCGGLEMAPSLNIGNGLAVCEPVHGSAPDIAGKGLADPRATVLSLALLARLHWRDSHIANQLENAVIHSMKEPSSHHSTFALKEQMLDYLSKSHVY